MKQLVVPFAVVFAIVGGGALAHGDEAHKSEEKTSAQDHATALGQPGDAARVSRTIEVAITDAMRFAPAKVRVKRGETIRFVLTNIGKVKHEMVLGTRKELKEHAALMRKFPEMEHADPNMASVEPGKTGELVWEFTRSGSFDFACLQPGHMEAGMVGKVAVRR
jgi:uncharacterized cupredoxin-like copper-binding protein